MATLKISDLSVGDWVRCRGRNGRIERLEVIRYDERISVAVESDLGTMYQFVDIEDIGPIPITAEILEKNGLVRHERDAYNPKSIVLSNHFIMARTYTDVDWWRVLIYDEELPTRELFNGRIYSVHQLQHALRLAGVDKEINL